MKPTITHQADGRYAVTIDGLQIGEPFNTHYQATIALGFLHSLTSLDLINIANAKKFGFYEHDTNQVHQSGGIPPAPSGELPAANP